MPLAGDGDGDGAGDRRSFRHNALTFRQACKAPRLAGTGKEQQRARGA